MSDPIIGPLTANLQQLLNNEPIRAVLNEYADKDDNFSSIFKEAFETVRTTDAIDKNSAAELMAGVNDDLSGLLIDMQKAEIALQLTLQIRNKLLDAYNEVMRMTV